MAEKPFPTFWLTVGAVVFLCVSSVFVLTARSLNYDEYQRQQAARSQAQSELVSGETNTISAPSRLSSQEDQTAAISEKAASMPDQELIATKRNEPAIKDG